MSRIENNKEFTDFITLVDARSSGVIIGQPVSLPYSVVRWVRSQLLLLLIVVVPGVFGAIYYGFICADQYASETQFVVRSPNRNAAGLLSGFLQSTGFVRAQDDSYIVTEFIKSRAAVDALASRNDLKAILSRPEGDFLSRYPLPWAEANNEELYQHYLRFINVHTDSGSGVTTLDVRAFRADDAYRLANALVQHAEELINRLNDRAREDAIRYAQIEVNDSQTRLSKMQTSLTDFRNREALVDPNKQSAAALDMIARLSDGLADNKARLSALEEQAPQSPQGEALRARVAAMERQISDERTRIVGSDGSMAPRIAQYEQLLLEREMAAKMLTSATTSLENARIDAQRQQLYLERIADPNLPDHALYPKRLTSFLLLIAVCFATFWIVRFLVIQVYEHAAQQ
ncbi:MULTISPECIES: capsule biosynthesis protein [unclassified Rhizobium]|uniref:capsule biosynthesis protein n=1 Tax=unclassified Rhizobium TaxID=2613769 RepID=UPI00160F14A3|nr:MULTISPECIES: capsule biosynthesis protein [unclassified Rhizobium]MBB3385128.1 capsular polysaccharide transport system permease protein [Rhizobium sp. BK098]MBB3617022.1 capsular polysaccharide transport system permease protein [Rhizobium sp. BK609]MBB3682679.1 capsular polysaccharide transport system permease protein [Rhizobium sp. BK612]